MANSKEEDLLFKNVQSLRKRLQQTQHNLQSLQHYENGIREDISEPPTSPGSERMPALHLDDLSPASNASRHRKSKQQKTQHQSRGSSVRDHPSTSQRSSQRSNQRSSHSHGSDVERGMASSNSSNNNTIPYSNEGGFPNPAYQSTPTKSSAQPQVRNHHPPPPLNLSSQSVTQVENETLRQKLHLVREENAKLVSQNHKLLTQLETATYQLHHRNAKIAYLEQEGRDLKERIPELEERVIQYETESEVQENALREVESRYEDSQRQHDDLDNQLKHTREQLKSTREELARERKSRKRADGERDAALRNIEELQEGFDQFERKAKDKVKRYQTGEEHLKESLRHADHEREELLDKNTNLQVQIDDLQEEIRALREENVTGKDMQSEQDQQNLDLRSQLARHTQKIARLEGELQDAGLIRQENSSLRRLVDQQGTQLDQAQREIGESHAHLVRLEEVASRLTMRSAASTCSNTHSVAGSDSGVSTSKAQSLCQDGNQGDDEDEGDLDDLNGSYLETLESKEGPHGSSANRSLVSDLRHQLAHKEAEIQRLRTELEAQAAKASSNLMVDGLKMELQAAQERNAIGERRATELERMISHLEAERTKHVTHIIQLEEKSADLEVNTSSLESRLTQRSNQVAELQKEVTEKSSSITSLEREVRKKTSQIQSLERHLDDKVAEVSEQVTRVTELEEEVTQKSGQLEKLRGEADEKRKEHSQHKDTADRLRDVHKEQMEEMEKQIELMERKWEDSQGQLSSYKKEVMTLRNEITSKEIMFDDTKRELDARTNQEQSTVSNLQLQISESTDRCRQLEGALLVCKEEVRVYLNQMEEDKDQNDLAVASRDEQIQRLQLEGSNNKQAVEERDRQISELLSALEERQDMLQNSNTRIGELEDMQGQLEAQMSKLEQELHREQTSWQTEVSSMEKKLQQACTELEHRTSQIQEMTNTIKEMATDKKNLTDEVNELERRLHQEGLDTDAKGTRLQKMDSEIRELQAHLNEKIEQIEEEDEQIQNLQDELAERDRQITSLDRELSKAEGDVEYLSSQVEEAHRQLEQTRVELEDRDEQITNFKHSIRRYQDDLRNRTREVDELDQALKDRQWELQQRAAQVTQLDMTIKEHKVDVEQHIIRLEGSLKKSQIELQQKNKQISELDKQVENLQEEIRDKMVQIQQIDTVARQQRTELESKTDKLQELQQLYDASRTDLSSTKEEILEVTQQLRLAREASQKLQLEMTETKREAALSQRELERVNQELEEALDSAQTREDEVAVLSNKLGDAKEKEVHLESRNNSDVRKLRREVDILKENHRQEMTELRESHTQTVSGKDQEIANLRVTGREVTHHQEALIDELERARSELASLEGDLFACKDVIEAANETIVLKEAHIARLEAKVHGYERAALRGGGKGSQGYMNPQSRSSSESNMLPPRSSLQRSLKMINQNQHPSKKSSTTRGGMQRSISDQSLPQPSSPRSPNTSDLNRTFNSDGAASPNHSVLSADELFTMKDSFSKLKLSPRSSSNQSKQESDPDSFVGMLMEVNQMYYNYNPNNTASATTPTSSANLKAMRDRLFSDSYVPKGGAKSSHRTVSRSASSLTGPSSSLLRPRAPGASINNRPVSDSYPLMGSLLGGGKDVSKIPSRGGSVNRAEDSKETLLSLDVLSGGMAPAPSPTATAPLVSVESLLALRAGSEGAHGAVEGQLKQSIKKQSQSGKDQLPQQEMVVAHANEPRDESQSSSVSRMIERLAQRASVIGSQMEAQVATFNHQCAEGEKSHKYQPYATGDDDDDSSDSDADFREHEPETAVQRDMINLNVSDT